MAASSLEEATCGSRWSAMVLVNDGIPDSLARIYYTNSIESIDNGKNCQLKGIKVTERRPGGCP